MAKKWIQKAVKRPGRMKEYCGGKVTQSCIERAKRSKSRSLRSAANLAERFRSGEFKHRKKR